MRALWGKLECGFPSDDDDPFEATVYKSVFNLVEQFKGFDIDQQLCGRFVTAAELALSTQSRSFAQRLREAQSLELISSEVQNHPSFGKMRDNPLVLTTSFHPLEDYYITRGFDEG